jgi:hypothetical protein
VLFIGLKASPNQMRPTLVALGDAVKYVPPAWLRPAGRRPTANCDSGHSATRGIVLNLDNLTGAAGSPGVQDALCVFGD